MEAATALTVAQMLTIKNFLLDADSKCQELTNEGQYWVQNLKDVVYDADDLLDEFNTISHQLKEMPGGKLLRSPYVLEESIIGRDADKETIVDLLLKDESEKNISFVTIVGIGGLGKTALAQLVFEDHRIKEAFQEKMYWVCVSENFDRDQILGKIHKEKNKECTLQKIHRNVQKLTEGKRYLLVLDDMWYEERKNWGELKDFLNLGGRGSRILKVSQRRSLGNYSRISLEKREDEAVTDDLVEIGEDILEKCANVPLSIKVVANLLFKQDIAVWESFRSIDLANFYDCEKGIMPTLMFSYYHLSPELKTCFSFCSLFPEDYEIDKLELIHLRMAQGYLVPSSNNESMEDVGEKYLSI
ncbi:disease resistance protein RGA2-like [Chenopodium quinoa]|uniref:disease resistance protein RGA2-like n=1 Tax=Chenopodium quinoa TaxID=63459 RepID=UPI000B78E751|nr:disease resistance protein RGA2-like [Chenopodium quinoa]